MEYPVPPGYVQVLIARGCLVGLGVAGLAVLWWRLARWKFIRPVEMVYWYAAGIFELCIVGFGSCAFTAFDDNSWQTITLIAAEAAPIAGVMITFFKYDQLAEFFRAIAWSILVTLLGGAYLLSPTLREITMWPKPRHGSPQLECLSNGRQLGMAIGNSRNDVILPSVTGNPAVAWRVSILSTLDRSSLSRAYDTTLAWDEPPNARLARQFLSEQTCPSNYVPQDDQARRYTAFSMPTGSQAIGDNAQGTRVEDITDGGSNTLLIVEASGSQIVWTEPRDVNVATQPAGINLKGKKPGQSDGWLSSYHRNGVNVVMADGGGRFLSANTDAALLKKLATINADDNEDAP